VRYNLSIIDSGWWPHQTKTRGRSNLNDFKIPKKSETLRN